MARTRIRVGIGGWTYEPWRETFYPQGLPKTKELSHASRQVTTIEINATFYRTQSALTFRKWAAETPDDFVFALKASRYACGRKDLADGDESIRRFVGSGITELGAKLGPVLWQLAPTKRFRAEEIDGFFAMLSKNADGAKLRHVVEPRHKSFGSAEFIALARRYGVAVCLSVHPEYPLIADQTADFAYVRLQTTDAHEPAGYNAKTVTVWAANVRTLAEGRVPAGLPTFGDAAKPQPRDAFVYVIGGAKERNPAAARALLAELAGAPN